MRKIQTPEQLLKAIQNEVFRHELPSLPPIRQLPVKIPIVTKLQYDYQHLVLPRVKRLDHINNVLML